MTVRILSVLIIMAARLSFITLRFQLAYVVIKNFLNHNTRRRASHHLQWRSRRMLESVNAHALVTVKAAVAVMAVGDVAAVTVAKALRNTLRV